MSAHLAPPTTHTLEMTQAAQINDRLKARSVDHPVTAADLALAGRVSTTGVPVPPTAVLTRLVVDGPPEFPYLHAHFFLSQWRAQPLVLDLEPDQLLGLSHLLGLRHRWAT